MDIYVHILGMYLDSDTTSRANSTMSKQLTDLVIQKILTLGKSFKQELKQALDKSPDLKTKFSNALRISTSQQQAGSNTPGDQQQRAGQLNKTPKIQLSFNFSTKR